MDYLIRGIPIGLRLALFAAAAVGGALLQFGAPGLLVPGTLVVAAGVLFVAARSYSNKPKDLGFEEWKPVSFEEIRRISANLKSTKKSKVPFLFRRGAKVLPIVIGAPLFFLSLSFAADSGSSVPSIVIADAVILGVGLFFTGLVKLWVPKELAMKLELFSAVIDEQAGSGLVVTPYLRFDKDSQSREIPEDLRFMVELRKHPEDFVGCQFQIAVNNGPNGAVPYMYAVFLCRGKGGTYRSIAAMPFVSWVKEAGGDDAYGTVVIRQETSGTGYHTKLGDCRRLYDVVTKTLAAL